MPNLPAYHTGSLVISLHAYDPEHLIITSTGPSACAMQTYITGGMQAYLNGRHDTVSILVLKYIR